MSSVFPVIVNTLRIDNKSVMTSSTIAPLRPTTATGSQQTVDAGVVVENKQEVITGGASLVADWVSTGHFAVGNKTHFNYRLVCLPYSVQIQCWRLLTIMYLLIVLLAPRTWLFILPYDL